MLPKIKQITFNLNIISSDFICKNKTKETKKNKIQTKNNTLFNDTVENAIQNGKISFLFSFAVLPIKFINYYQHG